MEKFFVPSYEIKKSYILLFDILSYYIVGEKNHGKGNTCRKGKTYPRIVKNRSCNHPFTVSRTKTIGV